MSKIAAIEHLRALAERAKAFTNALVAETVQVISDSITELHNVKADKGSATPCLIPTTGWENSGDTSYPKYYDIAVTGITANDRAAITIAPKDLKIAKACGLCPTCQTFAGKIRVFAATVPTEVIAGECWIEDGKE